MNKTSSWPTRTLDKAQRWRTCMSRLTVLALEAHRRHRPCGDWTACQHPWCRATAMELLAGPWEDPAPTSYEYIPDPELDPEEAVLDRWHRFTKRWPTNSGGK